MPTTNEASRLNLEYYKKQAKALLKAHHAGDPQAHRRVSEYFSPSPSAGASAHPIGLQEAQLVIAREQGFASWPRFKVHIEKSQRTLAEQADAFVKACCDNPTQAKTLLDENPALAGASVYTALVMGDAGRVRAALDRQPGWATQKGGPNDWEPLLYVCFSRWAKVAPEADVGMLQIAHTLLAAGADPNAFYPCTMPGFIDWPLPCLYGASGATNRPQLTRLLLESGANPNDGESLYHSTEHPDLQCVRVLLEYASAEAATGALNHMLDREDLVGLKLLLDRGADPSHVNDHSETALHWAVWRRRSATTVSMLLDYGASSDAKRSDGLTAYAMARRMGLVEVATVLEERGADTALSPLDQLLAACAVADTETAARIMQERPNLLRDAPEAARMVADMAVIGNAPAVRGLLMAGFPPDTRGDYNGTPLHWAAWKGYADVVSVLLEYGHPVDPVGANLGTTPLQWACHGVKNCPDGAGQYAEIARLLIAAGAKVEPSFVPTGSDEVDSILRERIPLG